MAVEVIGTISMPCIIVPPLPPYKPPVTTTFGQVTKTLLGLVLLFSLTGCPKPSPPIVYPPDADASQPTPPAPRITCDVACLHASNIPGAASFGTCMGVCQPIQNPAFAICLNNAKTIADINACDH